MGGSEKEKKEKKDKADKKDKKKERAESKRDLRAADAAAKTEEANQAAQASAPAAPAAPASPVAAKDAQPAAEIAAAAPAPSAAPAAPLPAAVAQKEPVATPASPGREADKKTATRERAKTLDDGVPSNSKKEKEREGKPKYEFVDLNKQARVHHCASLEPSHLQFYIDGPLRCVGYLPHHPPHFVSATTAHTPSLTTVHCRAMACARKAHPRVPGRAAVRC